MKITSYIFAGLAVLALMIAGPVKAEMSSLSDSDMDTITGKGDSSVTFDGYDWDDKHGTDSSDHKGGLFNSTNATTTLVGVNTANVWGVYAGSESFGALNGGVDTIASSTANAGIGGF